MAKKKLKKIVLAAGDKGDDDEESENEDSEEDSEEMSEEMDEDEDEEEGSDAMDDDKSGSDDRSDMSGSDGSRKKKSKEPQVKQPGFKITKGEKQTYKPHYAQASRKQTASLDELDFEDMNEE